jgi:hypothetical protein
MRASSESGRKRLQAQSIRRSSRSTAACAAAAVPGDAASTSNVAVVPQTFQRNSVTSRSAG